MAALDLTGFHLRDTDRDGLWLCCLLSQRKWRFTWGDNSDEWLSGHIGRCAREAAELCRPAPRDDDD